MGIMFHKDPFIVAFVFQQLGSFFPGNIVCSGTQFAEAQFGTPFGERLGGIFDEHIFEVDCFDPVIVFFNGSQHIAAGTVKMTDIQQKISPGDFFHETIQFFLIFNTVPQVVVQRTADPEAFCSPHGGVGTAQIQIHIHSSAHIPAGQPDIGFTQRGGEIIGYFQIRTAAGGKVHTHSFEGSSLVHGIGCINTFQSFDSVIPDGFQVFQTLLEIVISAVPDQHPVICNTKFHFYSLF